MICSVKPIENVNELLVNVSHTTNFYNSFFCSLLNVSSLPRHIIDDNTFKNG